MKKFKTASGEPPVLHRNSANLMQNMLDEVKASITVLPELKALIPSLQNLEYKQLTKNILTEGCREPLLIWQTTIGTIDSSVDNTPVNILIDGHNRYEICTKHNIDFKITLRDFATLQVVHDFMIDNQLGRRNLTPEQMSYLRGLKYRNQRQLTGRPIQEPIIATKQKETQVQRTRDKLAKQFNVSPSTILRDSEYSEGLDRLTSDLKQDVLKGNQKISKEVIRQIGRSDLSNSTLLSLDDITEMKQPANVTGVSSKSSTTDDLSTLVQQIILLANRLSPANAQFVEDCEQLMGLVKEAKKQAK